MEKTQTVVFYIRPEKKIFKKEMPPRWFKVTFNPLVGGHLTP